MGPGANPAPFHRLSPTSSFYGMLCPPSGSSLAPMVRICAEQGVLPLCRVARGIQHPHKLATSYREWGIRGACLPLFARSEPPGASRGERGGHHVHEPARDIDLREQQEERIRHLPILVPLRTVRSAQILSERSRTRPASRRLGIHHDHLPVNGLWANSTEPVFRLGCRARMDSFIFCGRLSHSVPNKPL